MSTPIYIRETYVNLDKGWRFGESDVYETDFDDKGKLYRSLVREYGRCTGKMYVDLKGGRTIEAGWVFVKRMQYDDSNETYLREVWVSLHSAPDTITRKSHYLNDEG